MERGFSLRHTGGCAGRLLPAAALCVLLAVRASAAFVDESMAAHALYRQAKWPEAAAAFAALAAQAPDAHRDACRVHQARALAKAGQFDDALTAADAIADPHRRAYARMQALQAAGRWADLLAAATNEPIAAWPDDLDYLGHQMRGLAYLRTGRPADALPDLEQAAAKAGTDAWPKMESLYYAMNAAESAGLPDRARAAAAAMLAEPNAKGGWPYLLCAFWSIHDRIRAASFAEAEQMLDALDAGRTWGDDEYALRYYEARGDLALARGDTAAARSAYARAVAVKTHASYVERVRKKAEALP